MKGLWVQKRENDVAETSICHRRHIHGTKFLVLKLFDEIASKLWSQRVNRKFSQLFQGSSSTKNSWGKQWRGGWCICLHLVATVQQRRFSSEENSHLCWRAVSNQASPKTILTPAFPCGDPQAVSKATNANKQLHNSTAQPIRVLTGYTGPFGF